MCLCLKHIYIYVHNMFFTYMHMCIDSYMYTFICVYLRGYLIYAYTYISISKPEQ